jgi:phosphatidylglycerophosphate synthase
LVTTDWPGYADQWAKLHGGYNLRQASPLVRGWLWFAYRSARALAAVGMAPSTVTSVGVVLALGVVPAALAGGGWPVLAAVLVVLGALADSADGALALLTGRETRLGRLYDSVADRVTEAAWLTGLWALGAPGWLITFCGALAWMHEYLRARAAIAGLRGIGIVTAGERPTRVLVAAFGFGLAGAAGLAGPEFAAGTMTVASAVWAVLGGLGLIQLAGAVHRSLANVL